MTITFTIEATDLADFTKQVQELNDRMNPKAAPKEDLGKPYKIDTNKPLPKLDDIMSPIADRIVQESAPTQPDQSKETVITGDVDEALADTHQATAHAKKQTYIDPSANLGKFTTEELQNAYTDHLTAGKKSAITKELKKRSENPQFVEPIAAPEIGEIGADEAAQTVEKTTVTNVDFSNTAPTPIQESAAVPAGHSVSMAPGVAIVAPFSLETGEPSPIREPRSTFMQRVIRDERNQEVAQKVKQLFDDNTKTLPDLNDEEFYLFIDWYDFTARVAADNQQQNVNVAIQQELNDGSVDLAKLPLHLVPGIIDWYNRTE